MRTLPDTRVPSLFRESGANRSLDTPKSFIMREVCLFSLLPHHVSTTSTHLSQYVSLHSASYIFLVNIALKSPDALNPPSGKN
jgi:hypothetical protein